MCASGEMSSSSSSRAEFRAEPSVARSVSGATVAQPFLKSVATRVFEAKLPERAIHGQDEDEWLRAGRDWPGPAAGAPSEDG